MDSKPFEFVIIPSDTLHRRHPDPEAFAEHFSPNNQEVLAVHFPSLGKDAMLLAPNHLKLQRSSQDENGHLAIFMRRSSAQQINGLWKLVGEIMSSELEKRKNGGNIWLSTAGDGIAWLHIRLDTRPKYYNYGPYKKPR